MEKRNRPASNDVRLDDIRSPELIEKHDLLWSRPGYLIRRLHQAHVALFMEECADVNITPVQFGFLTILDGGAKLDQATLGAEVGIDRTTTADVVNRLEGRGLIRRETNPGDRRMRIVSITPEGRDFVRSVVSRVEAAQVKFLAPFSEQERAAFLKLAAKLADQSATPNAKE